MLGLGLSKFSDGAMNISLVLLPLLLLIAFARCEEEEGGTSIKPGQEAKCTKCIKAPYLARHASFCVKCSEQGATKGELKGDCTRCKSGSKYAKKHMAFCTDSCGGLLKKKKKVDSKTKMKKKAMAPKKKKTTTMKATPVSGLSQTQSATKISAMEPLGPLAELFKSLVVANTW